jgi:class 3 adenylate cyclase
VVSHAGAQPRFDSPDTYTPKHLAERILTSKAALEGERKQVTVLFADLKGSMELLADRDPEEARKLLDPVLEHMMEAVHRFEGTVNQVMGDGIMALFGAPLAHEDHAVRACYAALRMQELVKRYSEDARHAHGVNVHIRVGLNSGEVVVRAIGSDLHMDYTAVGQTTHLAARMEQFASPGSILLTPSTLNLVEGYVAVKPLGPVPVKGLADAVKVYEVTGTGPARTRLQAAARRGLTRFVGRDAEVEQLRHALDRAGAGHGQVVAIVGEAGVGKSRLFYEFIHSYRVQGWLILECGSVSYGKATAYLPVIDLLKGYVKIQDRDDQREIRDKVIGRGLRLMTQVSPDRTQTLEVLGTRNLLNVLRTKLEAEGVGVASTRADPPPPVIIEPLRERLAYDIAIPITKPSLVHEIRKLSELNVAALDAIYEQEDLAEQFRVKLRLDFATTETDVHQADIVAGELPPAQELLASITNKVIDRAKLPNRFAEMYPAVRDYVATRCFGRAVDMDAEALRSHLARLDLQEGIAKYLARQIAELTVQRRAIEFEKADFRLSETRPFSWRRNLPPLEAKRTVFNYVATYNDFERRFAQFLDKVGDVLRFTSLGTTEQGESGMHFRVDYLKSSGAIGFYYPDWVVVQKTKADEVNWIIETKGRVWEGTAAKDEALRIWCERVSPATGREWRYARINQTEFDPRRTTALGDLVTGKTTTDNEVGV